ncbi:MAG: hypothetical protein NUV73_00905, partial [Candidatus Daviesbacteria bacterium]|nr:hypothetical protein [Candidatus Daviesbacteria bacterium]
LNNVSLVTSGNDVPVYSVVNPWQIAEKEITKKFGKLGVIAPVEKEIDPSVCSKPERQLLPLWGFNG